MKTISQQIARQFREAFLGGSFSGPDLKGHLEGITLEEANQKIGDHNTIYILTCHIHYYIRGVLQVLKGGPLEVRDKYSFDHPPLTSQKQWEDLQIQVWNDVEEFAALVAQMPEEKLKSAFIQPEYGNYYRNMAGIIQHSLYHIGQIGLLRKLIRSS